MLELIKYLYDRANEAVKYGIPISIVKDETLFNSVMKMKYTIPNEDLRGIGRLMKDIDDYYSELISRYREKNSIVAYVCFCKRFTIALQLAYTPLVWLTSILSTAKTLKELALTTSGISKTISFVGRSHLRA